MCNAEKPYGVLILILSLIFLCGAVGCGSGGGGASLSASADAVDPGAGAPATVPLSVAVKTGRDFECFLTEGRVLCRSLGAPHAGLSIGSALFVEVFLSDSDVVGLEVFEDSLCFSTDVAERPIARTPGLASYCFGEVSGGMPGFNPATQGTVSLTYGAAPFSADDGALVGLTGLVTDGAGGTRNEDCDTDGETLTCDTFAVDL